MTQKNDSIFFATHNEKKLLFFILLVSFLIRLILAFFIQAPLRSDSSDYQALGMDLLNGKYSLDGHPTAYVGPGYPFFLSGIYFLFGEGQFYVKLIQSLLEVVTGYYFYGISKNFFSVSGSFLSLILFSFFPSNIIFSQAVLSETLFGFFSILIFYLVLKKNFDQRKALIFFTGILFGYAVLIRTAYIASVILIPLYLLFFREDLSGKRILRASVFNTVIFLTGFIIVTAPWSIRNKIEIGTYSLGTTAGVNFWAGSNENSTGTYYGDLVSTLPVNSGSEAEKNNGYFKLGLNYALDNPGKYMLLGIKKLGYLFSSERMAVIYFSEPLNGETSTQVYKKANLLLILSVNLPYFFIMLFGTWGIAAFKKKYFFFYGFILMWLLTIFLFVGLARYHYVLIPFFILGTVKFLIERKDIFKTISLPKKVLAGCANLFMAGVWISEFYLLVK